ASPKAPACAPLAHLLEAPSVSFAEGQAPSSFIGFRLEGDAGKDAALSRCAATPVRPAAAAMPGHGDSARRFGTSPLTATCLLQPASIQRRIPRHDTCA
ncbi:MAG: hypothetical protein K6E40_17160, partial [Desulfovibrio sp.]|nr:hypothetical protein [Desulfovibrio sp.]